jgi:hypothetical protein
VSLLIVFSISWIPGLQEKNAISSDASAHKKRK